EGAEQPHPSLSGAERHADPVTAEHRGQRDPEGVGDPHAACFPEGFGEDRPKDGRRGLRGLARIWWRAPTIAAIILSLRVPRRASVRPRRSGATVQAYAEHQPGEADGPSPLCPRLAHPTSQKD